MVNQLGHASLCPSTDLGVFVYKSTFAPSLEFIFVLRVRSCPLLLILEAKLFHFECIN